MLIVALPCSKCKQTTQLLCFARLPESVRVALNVREVLHGLPAEGLLLFETVRAPEGPVHLGAGGLQTLRQLHSTRRGRRVDHRTLRGSST